MTLNLGAGLLFDIDGTLMESDPIHLAAFNQVFGPYGHVIDHEIYAKHIQGFANEAIAAHFIPGESLERRKQILDGKEALFRELVATSIEPLAGLMDLLEWARSHAIPMAAVTNAPMANADLIIDGIKARSYFSHIISADDLAQGKPHPLPYLTGLSHLSAVAAKSVAFEDSRTGIASATGAGITTIGLATGISESELLKAGATLATPDYTNPAVLDLIKSKVLAA
ncbi:HAD-IA family hydrolase [Devosia sp. WQ 349]|uniref:HAD family hydrolase n=1 Tax=Devosia sp. WQ 349K1 TaxID=2800329 RepID=UPI001902E0DA|nr:HAD-IA family hydrolase [Devosia sp. WQ 349K1]MBK1794507.1 HAD-IA family hydrolase [Devosia sp. WQ 349K1]